MVDWDTEVFNTKINNEMYDIFYQIIIEFQKKKHVPKKVITTRPRDKPFKSKGIRLKMTQRKRTQKSKTYKHPKSLATLQIQQ